MTISTYDYNSPYSIYNKDSKRIMPVFIYFAGQFKLVYGPFGRTWYTFFCPRSARKLLYQYIKKLRVYCPNIFTVTPPHSYYNFFNRVRPTLDFQLGCPAQIFLIARAVLLKEFRCHLLLWPVKLKRIKEIPLSSTFLTSKVET